MFQVKSSSDGYEFETDRGDKYCVYFTQLSQYDSFVFKTKDLNANNFYYFGVERLTPKQGGKTNIFIKQTIAFILVQFFVDHENAVLVFNYSNEDNLISGRRKKFKDWFDEYAKHSIHQFYQHDYSNEVSLCAIYNRWGGLQFEELRNDIQGYIQSIGPQLASLK